MVMFGRVVKIDEGQGQRPELNNEQEWIAQVPPLHEPNTGEFRISISPDSGVVVCGVIPSTFSIVEKPSRWKIALPTHGCLFESSDV